MFDRIKNAISGQAEGRDLGDAAASAGLGEYGKYLKGVNFPASKDEIIAALNDNGAPEALQTHVESLAGDRFNSAQDVFKTLLKR